MRVAAFFYSEEPKDGFTPIEVDGHVGYMRVLLAPKGVTLTGGLDWAYRHPEATPDVSITNTHFIHEKK